MCIIYFVTTIDRVLRIRDNIYIYIYIDIYKSNLHVHPRESIREIHQSCCLSSMSEDTSHVLAK